MNTPSPVLLHPLYSDEARVKEATDYLIAKGCKLLQLAWTRPTEELHAMFLLELLSPPKGAALVDLGCGIGGLESYWHRVRPDLQYTFVNSSAYQIEKIDVPGKAFVAFMEEFLPIDRVDAVVICYALGHVAYPRELIARAWDMLKPGGKLLVFDAFFTSRRFQEVMHYGPLQIHEAFGAPFCQRYCTYSKFEGFQPSEFAKELMDEDLWAGHTPALLLFVKD